MSEYCKDCKTTKLIPLLEYTATVGTPLYCPSCGQRFLAGVAWYPEKDETWHPEEDGKENNGKNNTEKDG